jgi:hypothetical protein
MGEGIRTELGGSLTLGREGLPGLPHHQKPTRSGFGEGQLIYPPYLIGVPWGASFLKGRIVIWMSRQTYQILQCLS